MNEELMKMVKELDEVGEYLIVESNGVPDELIERLDKLNVYLARVNRIWADATYVLAKEKKALTDDLKMLAKGEAVKPSIVRELIFAMTADSSYVVKLAERTSRTIVHQCDNIRTCLSYNKEDMKLTRTGY